MNVKGKGITILVVTMLVTSFCYFHVKHVHASTFSNGFEDDFASWTSTTGNPETTTLIKHEGSKSFNHTMIDLVENITYAEYDFEDGKDFQLETYVYVESFNPETYGWEGGASLNYCPIVVLDTDGASSLEIGIDQENATANVTIYGGNRETTFWRGDAITLERWYAFKIHGWYDGDDLNYACYVNDTEQGSQYNYTDPYGDYLAQIYVGANYGAWNSADHGNATWFIDSVDLEGPKYYFNFDFFDIDNDNIDLYVDWELWNSTHDIGYTEGEATLETGTYTLKASKYNILMNTTTLDTETYGNSTIDFNLNMKRHQSCSNGFIVSNDTISSISVHAETPQLLDFSMQGTPPDQHGVGVAKNASYILRDGVNMTGWTYQSSPSHIYWDQPDGDEVLLDSYTEGNKSYDQLFKEDFPTASWYPTFGQAFQTPATTYKLSSAKFYIKRATGTSGSLFARLYLGTGSLGSAKPTGDPLANSDLIARSSISTSYSLITFQFTGADQYELSPNTIYVILALSTGRGAEQDRIGTDSSSPTHNGNQVFWSIYSSWFTSSTKATCFYVYGQVVEHDYVFVFPSNSDGSVGPNPKPSQHRVVVNVRLHGEWVHGSNVTVEGGPDNTFEWGLTDIFGRSVFKLKTGSYQVVATYQQYRKGKPVYVSRHMTIGIDLTEEDYYPDGFPDREEEALPLGWFPFPQLDLTSEALWVLLIPLILLIAYIIKKATEKPKRKWKYSYLK